MISQPAKQFRSVFVVTLVALLAGACSSQPANSSKPAHSGKPVHSSKPVTVGDRAAAIALDQLGTPYRYGGTSPTGFDCSGLVHYSYAKAGVAVPRTTQALWNAAVPVETRSMRRGDLLFFRISGKMSHVGLYLGEGRFVHAPSSGKFVKVESLQSDYYSRAFMRAGRPR